MKNMYNMARELANSLLSSKEGIAYSGAKFIFEGDDDALELLKTYSKMLKDIEHMQATSNDIDKIKEKEEELTQYANSIKDNRTLTELFRTEDEFNSLVSSVLNVFNQTLNPDSSSSGCSGSCGSCSGCH